MPYNPTKVLQLGVPDTAGLPNDYADRVTRDQQLSGALAAIDAFAAAITGSSCYSLFCPYTGSLTDMNIGSGHQAGGVLGIEFNRNQDRVITEVVVFAASSGSNPNAVVRVDVQVQQGAAAPANYSSIFTNNTFKPAYSGSTGFGAAKAFTFVSGSNMVWPKGTNLKVVADLASGQQAGLGSMSGLTAQVFWIPSGSYGA